MTLQIGERTSPDKLDRRSGAGSQPCGFRAVTRDDKLAAERVARRNGKVDPLVRDVPSGDEIIIAARFAQGKIIDIHRRVNNMRRSAVVAIDPRCHIARIRNEPVNAQA